MSNFLDGKKTYLGIAVIVAGWLGLGDIINDATIGPIVDNAIQLIGVVLAIYGRFVAKPKY